MSGRARRATRSRGFWAAWARMGARRDGLVHLRAGARYRRCANCCRAPASRPTQANIGFYGGVLFAIFLVGWGFAFLWGPIADRFGRVRTLVLTILCYSVFTFLGCGGGGRVATGRCSAFWPERASAANGRSAACSSRRSGPNRGGSRARRGCTRAITSASFSRRS